MTLDERIQIVHTPGDPRLADYHVVKERDTLAQRGVFIAEGKLVVERLLSPACRFRVRSLLILKDRLEAMRPAIERRLAELSAGDAPVFVADRATMDAIVGFRFHQGCLGVGAMPAPGDARLDAGRLITAASGRSGPTTLVVLEDLVDLDNVGAVFRNAAALGAAGVLLSPRCADPLYRKSIRTSMGHALLLPFARFADWPGGLGLLREAGFTLGALTPDAGAETLHAWARRARVEGGRIALMVGAEGAGLTEAAMRAADARVRIPMAGGVDSLNVATALAIALHEAHHAGGAESAGQPG